MNGHPANIFPPGNVPDQARFGQRLRALPALASESRTVFFDRAFGRPAVKVQPGEFFAWDEDIVIQTLLGSCVSVCLHDPAAAMGGMNHFLLPDGGLASSPLAPSARYGVHAMELLINRLLRLGATRSRLTAKVFGGAALKNGPAGSGVGASNVAFVRRFLDVERIPILSCDVLHDMPRRVVFLPATGQVLIKRLDGVHARDLRQQESRKTFSGPAAAAGTVELFRP